jgi:hypothetical protein
MPSNRLDPRPAADWLADAQRYEQWAARTDWNKEVSARFRRLAAEARARAEACRN